MPQLNNSEKQLLLRLVRETVRAQLLGIAVDHPSVPAGPLHDPWGVFVSIHLGLDLRGCIGRVGGESALYRAATECGVAAATSDSRFAPLRPSEIEHVIFEISVLSDPEPAVLEAIEVGRHGLIVESDGRRGLLLPQVASHRGWDRTEFLKQTCHKAGVQEDIGRTGARAFTFEALVFSEVSPG